MGRRFVLGYSAAKTSRAQYLAKNKYCCAVIDEDVPPLRKVLVEGEAYLHRGAERRWEMGG